MTSNRVCRANNRSFTRLYVHSYNFLTPDETDDTSGRFGVASQSDIADDRVFAEKASPTRRNRCSWLGHAHRRAGRSCATPTSPLRLVGESQTETDAVIARDEDSAMPPPDDEYFTPGPMGDRVRDRRETEMHGGSPRDRGSRKERRVKIVARGCERMDDSATSSRGFLVSVNGGGYRRYCNRYYRVVNLTVTQAR